MGNVGGSPQGAIIGRQATVGGNRVYGSNIYYCEDDSISQIGEGSGYATISGLNVSSKTRLTTGHCDYPWNMLGACQG